MWEGGGAVIYAENQEGIQLLDFYDINETETSGFRLLSSAYAVIFVNNKLLLGFNKYRKQWEAPAGKIEAGESPRNTAIRELYEETHQRVDRLEFKGIFRIFDQRRGEIRNRAVYLGQMDKLEPFIYTEEDEMKKIMLWDFIEDIGYVDTVDLAMIEMIHNKKI